MPKRSAITSLVVLVLCGGGLFLLVQYYRASSVVAPAVEPAAAAEVTPAGPALAAAATPLGTVVTQDGFTLYRFDKDKPKPPTSTCVDKCATTWPPVLVDGPAPAIDGVDPAAVGTVKRPDGSTQLTIGNWPVYRYSADAEPGDTTGEGVGGTWFAVGVDGKKAAGLATAKTPIGTVVTRGGYTLYRFDKDTPKPPKSTCVDKCAESWPPVLVQGNAKPQVEGVDPAAVGTVKRADGTTQLTIGNWPVYRYSGDKAPGETTGDGVGGTWFAVAPDGKKATAAPAPAQGAPATRNARPLPVPTTIPSYR